MYAGAPGKRPGAGAAAARMTGMRPEESIARLPTPRPSGAGPRDCEQSHAAFCAISNWMAGPIWDMLGSMAGCAACEGGAVAARPVLELAAVDAVPNCAGCGDAVQAVNRAGLSLGLGSMVCWGGTVENAVLALPSTAPGRPVVPTPYTQLDH